MEIDTKLFTHAWIILDLGGQKNHSQNGHVQL